MKIPSKDASKPLRCASGFVLYLESLANLMMPGFNDITLVADAVFCVLGTSSAAMTKDHVSLIKELWTTTIRIYFVDSVKVRWSFFSFPRKLGFDPLKFRTFWFITSS